MHNSTVTHMTHSTHSISPSCLRTFHFQEIRTTNTMKRQGNKATLSNQEGDTNQE